MKRTLIASFLALGACGAPELESTLALKSSTDLSKESIHSALCTRGNSPFKLFVAPDGEATGRIVQTDAQIKARIPPVEFPATFRATDKKTVLLEIPAGPITDDPVSEVLSPVIKGGEIVMRGDSFDCTDVRIREFN